MKESRFNESKDYLKKKLKVFGHIQDFRQSNLTKLILPKIKGKDILDIGCGNGSFLRKLKQAGKNPYGLEPSSELVEFSKKISPKIGSSALVSSICR